MTDILKCEKRDITGTLRNRRLRQSGMTPGVLYGRGESINLSIPSKEIDAVVRHGAQIVELQGGCNESALVKDVQWDALGTAVLHVDLTRIDASEILDLTVHVELVGVAPGSRTGGMVQQLLHEVEIQCKPADVPEKLELKINDLELDGALTAADIPLPPGVKMMTDPEAIVVSCVEVVEREDEDEDGTKASAEPEIIGRSKDDEGGEGDD